MKLLLDSHAWLWLAVGIQLREETLALCRTAAHTESLFLSPLSIWELARKGENGSLIFQKPTRTWIYEAIQSTGIRSVPFDTEVAIDSAHLPRTFHKDPIDRGLASTCRVYGLTLLTRDRELLDQASEHVFRAISV